MRVGVLGAGQLGQMLALAGRRLGLEFRFLSPDAHAPAARYAEHVVADYANKAALTHFAEGCDVVTYEFESIPLESVQLVSGLVPVYPPVRALGTAQDRVREKEFFGQLDIPTPASAPAGSPREVREALEHTGLPALIKSRRHGYDGKGQSVIRWRDDVEKAWVTAGAVPCIVESFVQFDRELSILAARSADGATACYPLVENHHSEGILRYSLAPAPRLNPQLTALAEGHARRMLEDLDYVGMLAIEFFERDGSLLANEMAPRVHNTGHWTIEGADTSQFENHLRAITGTALGSAEVRGAAGMVNIIGLEPDVGRLRGIEGVHVHMYGKSPAPRRKLGHITVVADELAGVTAAVRKVRLALGAA